MRSEATAPHADALTRSIVESFAEMAFVDVAPAEPVRLEIGSVIRIRYTGPEQGELTLHLPVACKRRIAENVYGRDWSEIQNNEIDDCLLELLNVVGGGFLRLYFGTEGEHDLALPELLFDDTRMGAHAYAEHYFSAEGDLFKVSFRETNQRNTVQGDIQ